MLSFLIWAIFTPILMIAVAVIWLWLLLTIMKSI